MAAEIARRYITLRAQQTALVLLAERENLDSQLVVIARQRFTAGPAVEAAEARLSDTRADQTRTRAQIAAMRVRLAVLTGLPLGMLASLPGGPIPLPPAAPTVGDAAALADYRAAAADAQAEVMRARAAATRQVLRARAAGALTPGEALEADRRALAALQAEERARAALTQAYVALFRPIP